MLNLYNFKQDYIKFTGNDRLDFINRLSTNKVDNLEKNKSVKTVLTSDKGRIVDLITLYNFGDFVFSACSFNNAIKVISHLDKYTIMDDFKTSNLSGDHETVMLFGDNPGEYLKDVFNISAEDLTGGKFIYFTKNNHNAVIDSYDNAIGGFSIIFNSKEHNFWYGELINGELHQKYSIHQINDTFYEQTRISCGIPAFGKEMSEDINPLECGLNKYINFTKGCYIGQEVIARLDTYDKINKHLVKIEADEDIISENAKINIDGSECGYLSSAIKNIALGFVKTAYIDFTKNYSVKQNNSSVNCKILKIN